MSKHSHHKIWIHFIWETLDHQKVISKETRLKISEYLFNYSKEKNIYMENNYVNSDHVHTLIDLPTNLSVEECIKLLKGTSSHYINQHRMTGLQFHWGVGYGAFSVSPSRISEVIKYIKNQEEHHRRYSYLEEYQLFLKKYSVSING